MTLPPSGINSDPTHDLARCERCGTLHTSEEAGKPCSLCNSTEQLPRCRCVGEIPLLVEEEGEMTTPSPEPDPREQCDHEPRIRRASANGVIFSPVTAEERRREVEAK